MTTIPDSILNGANANYIDWLFEQYSNDPNSVPETWKHIFQKQQGIEHNHFEIQHKLKSSAQNNNNAGNSDRFGEVAAEKQAAVLRLINAYRVRGHQCAHLDPLLLEAPDLIEELRADFHQLDKSDMTSVFNTGSLFTKDRLRLDEILTFVQDVYCKSVGAEYMHITDTTEKRWIQQRLESYRSRPELQPQDRRWLLTLLTGAEGVEKYLHTRYVGQKRFSLEGGDSLIPLLDELIQRSGKNLTKEIVIGMAHRGRLNVLTNILGKSPAEVFDEFEGKKQVNDRITSGDVKYHMGHSADVETEGGIIHLALGFNPSHLEIINPVIQGSVRARQQRYNDKTGHAVLPILIHGDSAFAGQGVVMETLNMSQSRGYSTGGTVHIVINNRIGFTTSNPLDTRSTHYCTDVGKMVQAPIFHVNGDDPEAVIFVARLALDYRNHFHKDVIIDIVCYRRHGHNEADEPSVTQPMMYQKIRKHPPPRSIYADQLISEGVVSPAEVIAMVDDYRHALDKGHNNSRPVLCGLNHPQAVNWKPFKHVAWDQTTHTGYDPEAFKQLGLKICQSPENFELHARVLKVVKARQDMAQGNCLIDWGFAENMAYATLLEQGYPVRLSGQDCGRGTFFHRHSVLHNQLNGETYIPLQHLDKEQPRFTVIDSLLSEEAVLGFEYGYASAEPGALTIWEAQFGDFANGAQVVIDQFISSAGAKWGLYCGLTLMLPHGYEGQGPEHSSARIERYLQLCAEHNIQVCVPTTPSQIFHVLRRQMIRPMRKPLILMTPKSLLRHPRATSTLHDLCDGKFLTVIDDTDASSPEHIQRIILCSGKVYFDLIEAKHARDLSAVAVIRIEQLYPFPTEALKQTINRYINATKLIWCQEEPQNQGAWDQIQHRFNDITPLKIHYVGRSVASAPATGYFPLHQKQQINLVNQALGNTEQETTS